MDMRLGRSPRIKVLLIGVAVVGAVLAAPQIAGATFPGQNGRIAFKSGIDIPGISTINPDGTGRLELLSTWSWSPTWSRNGHEIAFEGPYPPEGQSGGIYTMRSDGSKVSQVTATGSSPTWSPRRWIAFSGSGGIFKLKANGKGETRLTDGPDFGPDWSPDGKTIAFWRFDRTTGCACGAVYLMDSDGSDQRRVATGYDPSWSSDSSKIAFGNAADLWTMNADGSDVAKLTQFGPPRDDPYMDSASLPAWSPDGTKIAFNSYRYYMATINPDGSDLRYLADGYGPDWQAR